MLSLKSALLTALLLGAASLQAQEAPARTDEQILKSIKLPEGFEGEILAKPPQLAYPASVSAAVDGTLFVAIDENGSIDRKPGRGRVLRVRDTKGTGQADEFLPFAEMDSPRGAIWDGASGTGPGTLYVMHPPNLTAYTDSQGTGKADRQVDLVTGLGFDLNFRGADHTTNGCRLGIDGWIYIAVGDYGYVEARGRDGTTIKNRGGGIVRVRTDGTGLEIVSRGQRNIYDVAVSPTLDLFTRDNTNDGGGWNTRLSYVPPGAHMGYPTLFVHFPEDHLAPLADYGDGAPCGSLWVDEPGLRGGLYTVEWGVSGIMYHPLQATGAGWAAQQEKWLSLTRPTDIDVDGAANMYLTSWEGATFTYNGPNAGYLLKIHPKTGGHPAPVIAGMKPAELIAQIGSASGVARITAQRELLRRGVGEEEVRALRMLTEPSQSLPIRVAALETIKQALGAKALPILVEAAQEPGLRANALHALADDVRLAAQVPSAPFQAGLTDDDPRVRREAVTAIRRLKLLPLADQLVPLVADADPVVAHLSVRALSELNVVKPCLDALDSAQTALQPGALRALYGIYDLAAVDGIVARLPGSQGELRRGLLNALCRLDNQEEVYTDPKVWWGTRPDTSGPIYKPVRWEGSDRIEAALKGAVESLPPEEGRWLIDRMYLTKVNFPGLVELMLARAGTDAAAKLSAIEGMFHPDNSLPKEAAEALQAISTDRGQAPELRAKALRLLQRGAVHGSVFPYAVATFAALGGDDLSQPVLNRAFEDFTRDSHHSKWAGDFTRLAQGPDAPKRALSETVLINLATSNLVRGRDKTAATDAVAKLWQKPETAAGLLGAIARTGAKGYAEEVRARLNDPNNAVAEAALYAFQKLGLNQAGTAAPPIAGMKYEEIAAAVAHGGDAAAGKEIFLRAGCIACHTTSAAEPPKGPVLSAVAKIYDRAALTESILKPSAKIAQGFESQFFKTRKGEMVEGFVTREGGDSVDVRNIAGQTVTIEKADLAERGKRETSIMPEGLMNPFTTAEMASLLAYLESLKNL